MLDEANRDCHLLSNGLGELICVSSRQRFNSLNEERITMNACDESHSVYVFSMTRCEHEGRSVVFIAHGYHFVCLLRFLGGGVALRRIEDVLHVIGCDLVRRLVGAMCFFVAVISTHIFLQDCGGRPSTGY